jgi:hypothetical protein
VFSEVQIVAEETGFVTEADRVLCETQTEYEETARSIVNIEFQGLGDIECESPRSNTLIIDSKSVTMTWRDFIMCVCVCMCGRVCVRVRACVCVCVQKQCFSEKLFMNLMAYRKRQNCYHLRTVLNLFE